jgi:hypothetical protein
MATIIAGDFPTKALADEAVGHLLRQGIGRESIHCISLNAPGQHDIDSNTMAKSDEPSSHSASDDAPRHGAKGGASGAAIGGAVGLGIGAATAPVTGLAGPMVGAGVGAYVGSLVGTLKGLDTTGENEAEIRRAGILVAVHVHGAHAREQIADALRHCGARQVEIADGTWSDGQWADFNPESEPVPFTSATAAS